MKSDSSSKKIDLTGRKLLGPYGMNVFEAMKADATSTKTGDGGIKVGLKPGLKVGQKP